MTAKQFFTPFYVSSLKPVCFFTYLGYYILVIIWANQTRVTTVTCFGKWELSLISSVMHMLNLTFHLNVSCGWSYCALQRESYFQTYSKETLMFCYKNLQTLQHDWPYILYEHILGKGQAKYNADDDSYTCSSETSWRE